MAMNGQDGKRQRHYVHYWGLEAVMMSTEQKTMGWHGLTPRPVVQFSGIPHQSILP